VKGRSVEGGPRGPVLSPLHRVKLRRPLPGEHYVRRARLLDLVDEIVRAPLALVVAPAGSGKTSLLAGWTAETSTPTAWLSLDETDRDGIQLWSGVIAALETVAPGCGDHALAMLRHPRRRDDALDQLLVDLDEESHASAVLIVDDYHVVDPDQAVATSVAHFLDHLPSGLHVVLASRRDPVLPLSRLRSRGRLGELRFAELKFSPDEATELLVRLAPSLTEPRIEAAVERADGWAASLQLVALAARSARAGAGTEVSGDGEGLLLADYVLQEVLGNEAPDLIEALSAVAVVPRVNPRLAQELTGRADAGELLSRAERHGLLVTRDGSGRWFEMHALLRDVLTADLATRSPTRLVELHTRAARWFEEADEVIAALDQWIQADRPVDALHLLAATHAHLYDTGREATVVRVIEAIPFAVAASDLESLIVYAWCHVLVDRRRFVELVEQLVWWVDRSTAASDAVRARALMLQSAAGVMSGRWVESGELARRAMHALGDTWWSDVLGRFGWNMVARELALSERWDDEGDDVRQAMLELGRDPERRLAFEGSRAVGLAIAGRPIDALRVAAGVRRAAAVSEMTILRAELELAEALAHRELGDRTRAHTELEALAGVPADTMVFCRILASIESVEAQLDAGDVDAAGELFGGVEALVESESFGPDGRLWLARTGTRLALAAGDLDGARRWAQQVADGFWAPVCAARLHLVAGRPADALGELDAALPRTVRHEVILRLLRARSLADHQEALKCVTAAVELASEHGVLQTVASEGGATIELVEEAAWRAPPEWLDRLRRVAAEARCDPDLTQRGLVEPLTERERDVLRFLPSRLTIREIADELYVSVNTLKFHLKVIYRKLGVNSRAEAAEIARQQTVVRHQRPPAPASGATARSPSPSGARTPPG
jgi:ATP/maltotriose-dependent transcriptional regulator MalT